MRARQHNRLMLDGQRYGRLVVLEEASRRAQHRYWRCRCDCGTETIVAQAHLRTGRTLSCGCLLRDVVAAQAEQRTTHGASRSLEYSSWRWMRYRCTNPNSPRFAANGGQGIRICPAWHDFAVFLRDMGPRPSPRHRLTRIDDTRDFEPGNCRWEANHEQRPRKRRS